MMCSSPKHLTQVQPAWVQVRIGQIVWPALLSDFAEFGFSFVCQLNMFSVKGTRHYSDFLHFKCLCMRAFCAVRHKIRNRRMLFGGMSEELETAAQVDGRVAASYRTLRLSFPWCSSSKLCQLCCVGLHGHPPAMHASSL